MAISDRGKKKKGGRRRNYEPTVEVTGIRKILPTGWANWIGFVLFGALSIATLIEFFSALGRGGHTDWIPAILLTAGFAWIAVLFSITRWKDYM